MAIFKREKEIARRVEFDGLYIAETPEEDDIKAHWDKNGDIGQNFSRELLG